MSTKLCLTGKTFKGCASTSLYVNVNGVEIKGDVKKDIRRKERNLDTILGD